eukprot:96337-Pelagomonas_calceolata.AAC.3
MKPLGKVKCVKLTHPCVHGHSSIKRQGPCLRHQARIDGPLGHWNGLKYCRLLHVTCYKANIPEENRKENHIGSENTPYINLGKGETLAQRAVSLPHQRIRGKLAGLVWVW